MLESFGKTIVGFAVPVYLKATLSEEQRLDFAKNIIDLVADGTIKPLTGDRLCHVGYKPDCCAICIIDMSAAFFAWE